MVKSDCYKNTSFSHTVVIESFRVKKWSINQVSRQQLKGWSNNWVFSAMEMTLFL